MPSKIDGYAHISRTFFLDSWVVLSDFFVWLGFGCLLACLLEGTSVQHDENRTDTDVPLSHKSNGHCARTPGLPTPGHPEGSQRGQRRPAPPWGRSCTATLWPWVRRRRLCEPLAWTSNGNNRGRRRRSFLACLLVCLLDGWLLWCIRVIITALCMHTCSPLCCQWPHSVH